MTHDAGYRMRDPALRRESWPRIDFINPRQTGAAMDESSPILPIILRPNQICPYSDKCAFHRDSELEKCFGTVKRANKFICYIDELSLMYESDNT